MAHLLDDLGDWLSTGGIGLVNAGAGLNLYYDGFADSPDTAAAIYETGGFFPIEVNAASGPLVERPRVQVVTRAPTRQAARQLAHNIFTRLESVRGRTLGNTFYHWITAVSSPGTMGEDESGRRRYVCNFDVIKNMSTSTST